MSVHKILLNYHQIFNRTNALAFDSHRQLHISNVNTKIMDSSNTSNSNSNSNNDDAKQRVGDGEDSKSVSDSTVPPTLTRAGSLAAFPFRLHEMLEYAAASGHEGIVSWLPNKSSFKVHQRARFANEILPHFFNQTKFRSFQRQLNVYGFERTMFGPDSGSYQHPRFVRGDLDQCSTLTRQRGKRSVYKVVLAHDPLPSSAPASRAFDGASDGQAGTCGQECDDRGEESTVGLIEGIQTESIGAQSNEVADTRLQQTQQPSIPVLSRFSEQLAIESSRQIVAQNHALNSSYIDDLISRTTDVMDPHSDEMHGLLDGDFALFAGKRFCYVEPSRDDAFRMKYQLSPVLLL